MHYFTLGNILLYIVLINVSKYFEFNFNFVSLLAVNFVLFFPLIVKTLQNVIQYKYLNKLSALLWIYIICHPLFIIFLLIIDARSLPNNYSISEYLISNTTVLVQLIIVTMTMVVTVEKECYKYLRYVWFLSFIIGFEMFVFFYLLRDTSLHNLVVADNYGWFVSIILQSKVLAGLFGFFATAMSLYFARINGMKYKYFAAFILGIMLTVAAQERSIMLALLLFILGLILWNLFCHSRKNYFANKLIIILILIILVPIGEGIVKISDNIRGYTSLSLASSYDRIGRYSRGYDLFVRFFPIGSGANMDVKYMYSSDIKSPTLTKLYQWAKFNEDVPLEAQLQLGKIKSWVEDKKINNWQSVHSTYFEIIINYGFAGIIVAWLSVWYPAKYLFMAFRNRRFINKNKYMQAGIIYAIFILTFDLALNFISYGQLIWLICPFHIAFYKLHYKYLYWMRNGKKPRQLIQEIT